MNKTTVSALVAVAAITASAVSYISVTRDRIVTVPTRTIFSGSQIPKALKDSRAARIVNPKSHVPIHDTRYVTIRVSEDLSDENILARFVQGFFGGYCFGPERGLLRLAKKEITLFDQIKDIPVFSYVWSPAQLSSKTIPPVQSLLFGTFRLVDAQIDPKASERTSSQSYSYVDFVFGSDAGFIAGVHRFSVTRDSASKAQGAQTCDDGVNVTIEFAHAGCNPRENKPLQPKILQALHLWYAMVLFREGVAEVISASTTSTKNG